MLGVAVVDGIPYRFLGQAGLEKKFIARISDTQGWPAAYTLKKPSGNWTDRNYNDSKWTEGEGAFGSANKLPMVHTIWDGPELWTRRTFTIEGELPSQDVSLYLTANEYATVYVNGIKVHDSQKKATGLYVKLSDEVVKTLVPGKNVIAAYCANPSGSAQLDIAMVADQKQAVQFDQTAEQLYADVQAMQTRYGFTCGPVELDLKFLAPLFLDNLDLVSRPVNYIAYDVKSLDGAKHDVQIILEATPSWCVNIFGNEDTVSETYTQNGLTYLKASSVDQDILGKKGDDDRINWGSFYMAAEEKNTVASVSEKGFMKFVRDLGHVKA
jgi:hypothetical protein